MRPYRYSTGMPDKKAFLLRVDPGVWTALERLAEAELRSVNAQIEFLLREALARKGDDATRAPPRKRARWNRGG
jgi:hypothetical protein